MLIAGRAVAGAGAAGLVNGSMTIIAATVPLARRPAMMGLLMGLSQLGIVFGPLVGGALTEYATWRWCFYVNLPVGAVLACCIAAVHIPEQMPKPPPLAAVRTIHRELDLVGFVAFSGAAVELLLALQYAGGSRHAWSSPVVVGLLAGSAATYLAWWFAWNGRRGEDALLPTPILKMRAVWAASLTQMLVMTSFFVTAYYLPVYFQAVRGSSPMMSGVDMLPNILAQVVGAIGGGVLSESFCTDAIFWGCFLCSYRSSLISSFDTSTTTWLPHPVRGCRRLARNRGNQPPHPPKPLDPDGAVGWVRGARWPGPRHCHADCTCRLKQNASTPVQ